jgi:hypothetical protein
MMRTLTHQFEPANADPIGPVVSLTVAEIEEAGFKEVLQAPGAALGSWAILDGLLTPTGTGSPFTYREPLGQAREVKVALSGLFGRFVARAYLTRYFNLSIFAHLGRRSIMLNGVRRAQVVRTARGDLPDWVACESNLTRLTIAEAKGCHDWAGPHIALERAWKQAGRVDVVVGGRRAGLKRIAVATRWGAASGGPASPVMAVRDPDEGGDEISSDEADDIAVGIARHHVANLLGPLGHHQLASALKTLAETQLPNVSEQAANEARAAVAHAPLRRIRTPDEEVAPDDELIGGVVTRSGPLPMVDLSPTDQEVLGRLDLAPTFLGVERRFVNAIIEGQSNLIRDALMSSHRRTDVDVRTDTAAGWFVRLGRGAQII